MPPLAQPTCKPIPPPQPNPPPQDRRPHSVVETARVNRHEHTLNQYTLHNLLGQGQHGKVRRGYDNLLGMPVAIKIVKRKSKQKHLPRETAIPQSPRNISVANNIGSTENKIKKEIAIMKKLTHHHVVKLLEIIDDPMDKKIYMVLEYMEGGEIKWRDPDNKPILSVSQSRRIFIDVLLGLEYLHKQGIIHRDIKPANLLWTKDRSMVKISDFGVSHFSYAQRLAAAGSGDNPPIEDILMDESALTKTAGSPAFFAPELCYSPEDGNLRAKHQVTKAIDIWALGITLYCLLFAVPPFYTPSEWRLFQVIPNEDFGVPEFMGCDRIPTGGRHKNCPPSSHGWLVVDLLEKLLAKDPTKRITIKAIKRHAWIEHELQRMTEKQLEPFVFITPEDAEGAIMKPRWSARVTQRTQALFQSGRRRKKTTPVSSTRQRTGSIVAKGKRRADDASQPQMYSPTVEAHVSQPCLNSGQRGDVSAMRPPLSPPLRPTGQSAPQSYLGTSSQPQPYRSTSPVNSPSPSPGAEAKTPHRLHGFFRMIKLRRPKSDLINNGAGQDGLRLSMDTPEPSPSEPMTAASRSASWGESAQQLAVSRTSGRQSYESIATACSSDYGDPTARMFGAGGVSAAPNLYTAASRDSMGAPPRVMRSDADADALGFGPEEASGSSSRPQLSHPMPQRGWDPAQMEHDHTPSATRRAQVSPLRRTLLTADDAEASDDESSDEYDEGFPAPGMRPRSQSCPFDPMPLRMDAPLRALSLDEYDSTDDDGDGGSGGSIDSPLQVNMRRAPRQAGSPPLPLLPEPPEVWRQTVAAS